MRTRMTIVMLLLICTLTLGVQSGEQLFESCREKWQLDLNIPEAIKLCQQVVRENASNRSLLARAHYSLGRLYEGSDPGKAREHYTVVAGMRDQAAMAEEARTKLSGMDALSKATAAIEIPTPGTDDPFGFAVSPDGNSVVYQATVDGISQLWLWKRDTRKATAIKGTEDARQFALPFWSPDAKRIGFFASRKLKLIPVDGGSATELVTLQNTPVGGSWSSAGVILYAQSNEPLRRVSVNGGDSTVAIPRGPDQYHAVPRFLPDGRQFTYYRVNNSEFALMVGSLEGGVPRPVRIRNGAGAALSHPDQLLHVNAGQNILVGPLSTQRFDLQGVEVSGSPSSVGRTIALHTRWPGLAALSASANNPVIAYRADALVERQFVWFSRTGQQEGSLGSPEKTVEWMRLSSDGKTVAVFRREMGLGSLWLMNTTDGKSFQFREFTQRMVFSPTMDEIVWSGAFGAPPTYTNGIVRQPVNVVSGPSRRLSMRPGPAGIAEDLSSTGVLLFSTAGPGDLFALPLQGGEPIPIADSPGYEWNGRFSPDGRWIAYESNEEGPNKVYVQAFPGHRSNRLEIGRGSIPQWSQGGKELFFLGADDRVMVASVTLPATGLDIEIGTPRPLFPAPLRHGSIFEVAPGSQRILVNMPLADYPPIVVLPNGVQGTP